MSALDQAGSTYSRLILYCIQCVGAFGVYYIIISFVLFVIVFFLILAPFRLSPTLVYVCFQTSDPRL